MQDLMHTSGETANIAIFENGGIVFVSQIESQEPIRAFFRTGERRPAHASGIGKALLAEMPRAAVERIVATHGLPRFTAKTIVAAKDLFADLALIHVRGWALDDEERNAGGCAASPPPCSTNSAIRRPASRSPAPWPGWTMRRSLASARW